MKLKISIAHQGIALAVIPLAFELFFLASLVGYLHETEEKIRNQFRFRSIIENAKLLQRSALKYTSTYALYSLYLTPELKSQKDQAGLKVIQELSSLEKFSLQEPVLKEQFKLVQEKVQELFNILAMPRTDRALRYPAPSVAALFQLISQSLSVDLVAALDEYYEKVKTLDQKSFIAQEKIENNLKTIINIGIICNIIISLILVFLFTRYVTSRLSTLSDNASRMSARLPLRPPVRGVDEIATLDEVFHKMAVDLQLADTQKKELLGFINNQLQTPLQKTLEYLQSAQEKEKDNDKVQKRINPLRGNVLRLCSLVQELLDIENMDSGKLELSIARHSVSNVLNAAISAMQGYASSKNLQVITNEPDIFVECDALKLEQVIINFLSNAIKFSPQGTTIRIAAGSSAGDNTVSISVIDKGPGIPPEKLKLLFQRFQQANPEADTKIGGSGLGLNICKKIIEAHKGEIGVENHPSGGSCFWFRIPGTQPTSEGEPYG